MPASRDDDVYQAKLAEQAERYEGKIKSIGKKANMISLRFRIRNG